MGMKKWLGRRKWKKYVAALILTGGGTAAWVGLVTDPKPLPESISPVSDVQNVTVESIKAISESYVNYISNR